MIRRTRCIASLAVLCLLGACGRQEFVPGPGKSAADYKSDVAKCRLFVRGASPGSDAVAAESARGGADPWAGATVAYRDKAAITPKEVYNDCMEANGWVIAGHAQPAPAPAPMFDTSALDGRVGVTAQPLTASLVNGPATRRRTLGIRFTTISEDMTGWLHMDAPNGLLVLDVEPGGLAAAAGVRAGDVLLKFAGTPVASADDIRAALAPVHGGDVVAAEMLRDGQAQSVRLRF
jgi:hypothetical protein